MTWSGSTVAPASRQRRTAILAAAVVAVVLLLVTALTRGGSDPVALTMTEPTESPALPTHDLTTAPPLPSLTAEPSALPTPKPTTATRTPTRPRTASPRPRGAGIPMGVYRGAGKWGAEKIGGYETFVGGDVEYVLDFQATDTWSNQAWPDWQAKVWGASGKTVVLGATGIFPGDWKRNFNGQKVGWAQAAAGEYDAHWRKLGERLVAHGQPKAVLRGAHEFNGGWFPHRVEDSEVEDFKKAWRRWVTIMRKVPGNEFTFDWNPTVGQEALRYPEVAYPGDAYVDRIALDVYDGWYNKGWTPGVDAPPTDAERDKIWNHILHGERGLLYWKKFAKSRGKPMSFPEWGIRVWYEPSDKKVHGGGDNPKFIERMHAIITDPSWNVEYHAFWESTGLASAPGGGGVSDGDAGRHIPVPKSRAKFLELFGKAPR